MSKPFYFDLRIDKNTTLTKVFALKNPNETAFDLTGYSVIADGNDSDVVVLGSSLELNPTITNVTGGEITITVSAATTTALTGDTESIRKASSNPNWDLVITKAGVATKVIEGKISVFTTQAA